MWLRLVGLSKNDLKESGVESFTCDEVQRQLSEKGYKKGVIQDASFIEADLGKKRYYKEKKSKE